MQAQAGNVREHGTGTSGDSTRLRRTAEKVLRRRMWISPEQVRVRVDDGTATLTGAVGRRSTAGIAARLVAAVPGITEVADRIRYDFNDTDLVESKADRTHPFSADPFPPGPQHRRLSLRLRERSRRRPNRNGSPS